MSQLAPRPMFVLASAALVPPVPPRVSGSVPVVLVNGMLVRLMPLDEAKLDNTVDDGWKAVWGLVAAVPSSMAVRKLAAVVFVSAASGSPMAERKLVASVLVNADQPRSRFVRAVAALVAPVPPLLTANVPVMLDKMTLVALTVQKFVGLDTTPFVPTKTCAVWEHAATANAMLAKMKVAVLFMVKPS